MAARRKKPKSRAKRWMRKDFVDSKSFQAWKATGRAYASPYERGGFATDYQYRKARKEYKLLNAEQQVPKPNLLQRAVASFKRSRAANRIDRSLFHKRDPSGKSLKYSVAAMVYFTDGTSRGYSIQYATIPTVRRVQKDILHRVENPSSHLAHAPTSDPFNEQLEVESIGIVGVTKPRGK